MRFYFLIVLIIFSGARAYAENSSKDSYQEYRHKIKIGFCNIDAIAVQSVDINRDNRLHGDRLCKESKANLNITKCYMDQWLVQITKRSELARIIQSQYIHEIKEELGIIAYKFPLGKDVSGALDIEVDIREGESINGDLYYSVKYKATIKEEAQSRFGRKGYMLLDQWLLLGEDYYPEIDTLEEADIAAIKLVPKVVDKMKETFQEAREYCTVHNL